jgi:hypothetical protein
MSYNAIVAMVGSPSLRARITAAAAEAGQPSPDQWATVNMWAVCATTGWDVKWQYALDNLTVNANPDFGMRDDVLNDQDIKDGVAGVISGGSVQPGP